MYGCKALSVSSEAVAFVDTSAFSLLFMFILVYTCSLVNMYGFSCWKDASFKNFSCSVRYSYYAKSITRVH